MKIKEITDTHTHTLEKRLFFSLVSFETHKYLCVAAKFFKVSLLMAYVLLY